MEVRRIIKTVTLENRQIPAIMEASGIKQSHVTWWTEGLNGKNNSLEGEILSFQKQSRINMPKINYNKEWKKLHFLDEKNDYRSMNYLNTVTVRDIVKEWCEKI